MKKTLLLLMLFSVCISAQQIVIADSIEQMNEQLIGKIYYDPITNKLVMKNRTGAITQTLDISGSFVGRSDFNSLQNDVTNHINSNYTVNFGTGWADYTDYAVKLFPNWNSTTQSFDYDLYPISLDEFLGNYATIIANQETRLKRLEDSLAQLANFVWGGGGIVSVYPQYAFYYDPINMGINITSDTTITDIWIRNLGTATMAVSYRNPNAWLSVWDSTSGIVPINDSIKVYLKWNRNGAVVNTSYSGYIYINHNGGGSTGLSTTDTITVSGKWIQPEINPEVSANIYVNKECVACIDGRNGDTVYTVQAAINAAAVGDVIAIKKGQTFNENVTITKDSLYITSYGSGAKPVIANYYAIPNTSLASDWEEYANNVYRTKVIPSGLTSELKRIFTSTSFASLGARSDNVEGLSATQPWLYDGSRIYYYSTSAPAVWATQLYSPYQGSNYYSVQITGENVTVDGIDFKGGGARSTILLTNAHNFTLKNGTIKYSNMHGLVAYGCDNGILRNDSIMFGETWNVDYDIDEWGYKTSNGAFISGSNWSIDSNYFSGWIHAALQLYGTPWDSYSGMPHITNHNLVFDNYFTNTNTYGRAIDMADFGTSSGYLVGNRIYRNIIHNIPTTNQFNGDSTYFYYNIIDSIINRNGFRIDAASSTDILAVPFNGTCKNIFVFNNTVYHTDNAGMLFGGTNSHLKNNVVVNPRQNVYWSNLNNTQGLLAIYLRSLSNMAINNNWVFSTGKITTDVMFYRDDVSLGYTLDQFNSLTGVSGNLQSIGTLSTYLNTSNWDVSSPLVDAGVSISAYSIGTGFKDRNGNTVNQTIPNIGAIDNTP